MRRGVSELVSAVILIAIVLAAMILYMFFFSRSQAAGITSFRDIMGERVDQAMEMISILQASYLNGVIKIYVYNYGYKDVEIKTVYVGNQEVQFTITDVFDGQQTNIIEPGRTYSISISYTLNSQAPITIVTKSNRVFSITVKP